MEGSKLIDSALSLFYLDEEVIKLKVFAWQKQSVKSNHPL